MKSKFILAFLVMLVIFSCKKDNNNSNNLIGKWRFAGSAQSIGGPIIYTPNSASQNYYVQFGLNGQIESDYFNGTTSYKVSGGNTLTINYNTSPATVDYYYAIKNDTLNISGKNCIEGCAIYFVKE